MRCSRGVPSQTASDISAHTDGNQTPNIASVIPVANPLIIRRLFVSRRIIGQALSRLPSWSMASWPPRSTTATTALCVASIRRRRYVRPPRASKNAHTGFWSTGADDCFGDHVPEKGTQWENACYCTAAPITHQSQANGFRSLAACCAYIRSADMVDHLPIAAVPNLLLEHFARPKLTSVDRVAMR